MALPTKTLRYLLLATFILVPVINYLPFAWGNAQGRFNENYETRVDAAGYAFSIWGVIFLGMIIFAWTQLQNKRETPPLRRAYLFLISAGLASIAFVPISQSQNQLLGVVDLWWHLISLIGAYVALRAHVREMGQVHSGWAYFAPSMYLGWISAATVISTALALSSLGVAFSPLVAVYIALALIVVLTVIGLYLGLRRDGIYALTVAWALVAIAVEQQDAPLLLWGGAAGATVLAIVALGRLLGGRDFFYAS